MQRVAAFIAVALLPSLAHAQVACPSGHSDCAPGSYCSPYSITGTGQQCWPCGMCLWFNDSITGDCSICETSGGTEDPTGGGDIIVDVGESETTEMPTMAPTVSMSTAVPGSSTPLVCPSNCGTPERGGGTCRVRSSDSAVICTSCNEGRVRFRGRCLQSYACRAFKVVFGPLIGESCACDSHCHYCVVTSEGQRCNRCRDGWYLLNNTCVESCPADMTSSGISLWGRRCLQPFSCRGRAITTFDATFGCECPAPGNGFNGNCHICDFRAGEYGQHCTRCKNGKFLHNHTCVDDCSAAPGNISYNPRAWGRECREPFVCTRGLDESGVACKCHNDFGGTNCAVCEWGLSGPRCTTCKSSLYLHNGNCVRSCPDGFDEVGTSVEGRECVARE